MSRNLVKIQAKDLEIGMLGVEPPNFGEPFWVTHLEWSDTGVTVSFSDAKPLFYHFDEYLSWFIMDEEDEVPL